MKNNKILVVLSILLISTSSFAGLFDAVVGELDKAVNTSVNQLDPNVERKERYEDFKKNTPKNKLDCEISGNIWKQKIFQKHLGDCQFNKNGKTMSKDKAQVLRDERDAKIKAEEKQRLAKEEQRLKVLKSDELKTYFSSTPLKFTSVKKSDVTFAGIGQDLNYFAMIDKICKIESFQTINGIAKEKFCTEDNLKKRKVRIKRVGSNLGSYDVQGKTLELIAIESLKIVASPLKLKGVEFDVEFTCDADRNAKVLKGMIIDGSTPMIYISTISKTDNIITRYLTTAVLSMIKLKPRESNLYNTQSKALINIFAKKYPKLKKANLVNNRMFGYGYSSNSGNFSIIFAPEYPKDNYITYTFNTSNYGIEYLEIYNNTVRKELNTKGDDSDII